MQCPQCGKAASPNAKFCPACGARLGTAGSPVQRLQPGQLIHNGDYRIQRTLGKGGMGLVYLAENLQAFGRLCVVKEMLDYFDPNDPQQAATAHQRFEDEARTLSRLNHQGIPGILAYFSEGGHNYIVMDYVAGENLEQVLGRQTPESQIIQYGIQVCEILEYLTSLTPPVVHHDIKPANIIVDASANRARLVDFGTAKARLVMQPGGGVGLQKSSIYGTAGYAPPEQYKGQSEPRSDVYALAATLYHLVTNDDPGPHPFSFPQLNALSPPLRTALAPCLEDVGRRSTAAALRQALEAAATAALRPARSRSRPSSGALGLHESMAIVSVQEPPAPGRPQVTQILQSQLGLTAAAAEALTWQAPVGYLRGLDAVQAQSLLAQLTRHKAGVKAVRTSQLLSWRAGLAQHQQQHLVETGEVIVNRPYYPHDSVCHCYACGHEWKTRATTLARLRSTCSQCSSLWYTHRIFRCTICGHEFAHGDCVTAATKLNPQCPACQMREWLPQQQLQLAKSAVATSVRLPAGTVKSLHIALPARPNPAALRGRVTFNAAWLVPGNAIANGQIEVTINAAGLQPHQAYHADGWAITNGGSTPVSVDLYVEAPPQLVVASAALDFGLVKAQETRTLDLVIRNGGDGDLNGRVVISHSWLHLDKGAFHGKQDAVKCTVTGADLYQPGANRATLTLESNGGRQTIPVTAVALPTTLVVKPLVLDLGHRPRRGVVHAQLTLTNEGLGLLEGKVDADATWLAVDTTEISSNATSVGLTVKLTDLPPGGSYTGQLVVRSNGGDVAIPVQVRVSRHGWLGHLIRYNRAVQICLALLLLLGAGYGWAQVGRVARTAPTTVVARSTAAPTATSSTVAAMNGAAAAAAATTTPAQTATATATLLPRATLPAPTATPVTRPTASASPISAIVPTASPTATRPPATVTRTATPLATPSPTVPPATLPPPTSSPTSTATPTPIPLPTSTDTPAPPTTAPVAAPIVRSACPDPQAIITSPATGATVRGPIQIVGTATHKAFRYYKLEYTQGADVNASFSYLTGGETPVVNGVLADFYSYTVPNGAYTLRLTVVDASGNYPPPCTVTIAIRN